jgi:hypothetical protein
MKNIFEKSILIVIELSIRNATHAKKSDSNLANTVTANTVNFEAIDKIDFPFPGKSIFRHHKTYVANASNHNIVIILCSSNL